MDYGLEQTARVRANLPLAFRKELPSMRAEPPDLC